MFKLGYNTNGFTSHSLLSAIDIIGSHGYDSIAITIDHHALNPLDEVISSQILHVKKRLDTYQLSSIVETGARFLLNPMQKHDPTLISKAPEKREVRIHFIEQCLDIASALGSDAVSIWSGEIKPGVDNANAWDWLVSGCRRLCKKALDRGVSIGFEPEPGMLVENLSHYQMLKERVNHDSFKLTLDLGHAFITEKNVCGAIRAYKDDIVNIHIEDMKKIKHDHLFFGEGDMNFNDIFYALKDINYNGQVNIELSRHSHNAVETSENAIQVLNPIRHLFSHQVK
ncbi:MAG: sugar phosphate isomerase/epimerase [Deltaproteobacteria bacterium]|nr:sugar phosphate isomerase/epimerase [Deltaproteobacteria bacterium]